jgi:hypothetical protein
MILAIVTAALVGVAANPEYDFTLDAQFKCPQESANMDAYIHDLAAWLGMAKQRHPGWTNEQLANARESYFQKHHCPKPPSRP